MATKPHESGQVQEENSQDSNISAEELLTTDDTLSPDLTEATSQEMEVETVDTLIVETSPSLTEFEELRQQMLRVQADFDNFRRRTRQEKEDLQQFATRKLLSDLLPVVDNLERALGAFSADAASEVQTGVEMVRRQFVSVLEQYGVRAMDVTDQPFDPNFHDAVMQEAADGREVGVVVQELQKGYQMHGKVLRPAMVKVTV
ncbi:MAG: nucleotide exchange factor GrpE [Alicyclobacillus sp. RIFOXYA1_FULL_53_8]|nr:MAG: nucleotide exchange factor GrpE [Alicyclobacillus sp. RIFOXYA1_FULL_53_8]